jgi:hypothetical protein
MTSFVLPVRRGGLGNQMFQVAAALIYSVKTNKGIVLPLETPHIHRKSQPYETTIFRFLPTRLEVVVDDSCMMWLCGNHNFIRYPSEPGFEPWEILDSEKNIILHGYFQSYPPLKPYETYIRNFFLNALDNPIPNPELVGIHIRRGDFLKFQDVHFLQTEDYYKNALEFFPNKKFRIFTEDLDWVHQQEIFKTLSNVEIVQEKDEILALKKMIECGGGFICANSTFSWWGAFLGAYSLQNPIVAPKEWIKGGCGTLIPDDWLRI